MLSEELIMSGKAAKKAGNTSAIVLNVSGHMEALTSINRRYHLRQVVESNLPTATAKTLTAIMDVILATHASEKQLAACEYVTLAVNATGNPIVLKVFKNLWYNQAGKVTNNPADKVEEATDYLREYTISRQALVAYATTPSDYSLLSKVFQVVDLIPAHGKGSKVTAAPAEKV
jgi:hypothetical protein